MADSSRLPPAPPSARALRESCDRAIAELDRQLALPPGHPETLAMFGGGRGRLIVPPDMTAEQVAELTQLAHEGLCAELETASAAAEMPPEPPDEEAP